MLAPEIRERHPDDDHELCGSESLCLRAKAPCARGAGDRPDSQGIFSRRVNGLRLEPVPVLRQDLPVLVGDHQKPVGRLEGLQYIEGGRARIRLLVQLVADDADGRSTQSGQFAVDAAKADPFLLPEERHRKQTEHDKQRQRVPERQAGSKRGHHHPC
jgi:hypothetical protein